MIRLANPVHPGEILLEEYMKPLEIKPYSLAKTLGVTRPRIEGLVRCNRSISADMAIMLSKAFKTTPELWMNLQQGYDLAMAFKQSDYSHIAGIAAE